MKGTILIYRPGTTIPEVREIDGSPTLDVLKAAIGGGHLGAVPYFDTIQHGGCHDCVAFCDEDGKVKGLPMNMPATQLWDQAVRRSGRARNATPDYLVGDVAVVFGDAEFMEAL